MEYKTTITDNEVIARFMGLKGYVDHKGRFNYIPDIEGASPEEPKYSTSWEWLMPVVEKISRHVYDEQEYCDSSGEEKVIKYTAYPRTFGMLSSEGKIMVRFNRSTLFEADTLIEATYQAVVDWIRWYNTQSKP